MDAIHVGILSIIPPVIAISLALITKEVIFSLLLGIMSGTIIYSFAAGLGAVGIFNVTTELMISKISDNASMVIFLCMLGALVAVITRAGGSQAYGNWASRKLNTRRSAGAATGLLGILIFVDDYFNCLTVGTVMKPVTDRQHIAREKLAYLIDATAAPVCIIAPISSWAASVISYYPGEGEMSGMQAFVSSIPMNLYAVLTIFMVFWMAIRKKGDFGPMASAQRKAEALGDAHFTNSDTSSESELSKLTISEKGKVIDLIIPVVFLVIFSVLAMLFYGGLWSGEGVSIYQAFGDTDPGAALSLGGFGALFVAFFMFVPRKLMSFPDFFKAVIAGIKSMVPALVILALAWTISGVCRDLLSTGPYVAELVQASNMPVAFIPAIMFVIAAALSFATGTSWGTFGILIPIVVAVCEIAAPHLSVIALSSVLAGSVFGDHCSPISDTTILSSTGAGCDHIEHVRTQIPYAVTTAIVCFIGYIVAGFVGKIGFGTAIAITTPISFVMLIVALLILPKVFPGKES
jgi:Na+/H+ antiporter NhaC